MQNERQIDVISPFPPEELPRVWLWLQEAGSSLLNDLGPQNMDEFVDEWMNRQALTWGVYRDGELGGWVSYEPINETTGNAHCCFRKAFWGTKTTGPALTQVATDLFAIGVERIGMVVPDDNHAIQSLVKRLGAEKEAYWFVARTPDGQRVTRNGVPMPLVQYGLYPEALIVEAAA